MLNALEKRKDISEEELHKIFTKKIYYHLYRGDYEKARQYQQINIAYYDKTKEYINAAGSRYGMFLIAFKQNDLPFAKKNYTEALSTLDELPETPFKYAVKSDLDQFYFLSGNYLDFAKYHTETYQKFSETVGKSDIKPELLPKYEGVKIDMLASIADNYLYAKKRDSAQKYINKAKEIERKILAITKYPIEETTTIQISEAQFLSVEGNIKKAVFLLEEAKRSVEKSGNKELLYICLSNLSLNYYLGKDYKKSLESAEKAIQNKISLNEQPFDYELMAYEFAGKSALKLDLKDKALYYSNLFVEKSKNDEKAAKQKLFAELYKAHEIIPLEKELGKAETNKKRLITISIILLIGLCFVAYIYLKQRKKLQLEYEKFQKIVTELDHKKEENIEVKNKPRSPKPKEFSDEKSLEILQKLEKFEKGKLFLKPEMSLAFLAGHLQTNVNTLSGIINQSKNQNFNDYINGLRIDYIIEKLQTDPKYRNFKISFLAEECGFSSHSLFAVAFKKRHRISPSQFISFLSNKNM